MAKGREEYQARQFTLQAFGKDLARRAKSKCELCEAAGVKLSPYEVPPEGPVPEYDQCILICDDCREALDNPKKFKPGEHWRVLAQTVWSDVTPVQVAAVRLLRRQGESEDWAREALEGVYLDEELEEWVTKVE